MLFDIYCDLSKAFDYMHYNALLLDLRYYNSQNQTVNLMNSFLHNIPLFTYHFAYVNGMKSFRLPILLSIPQGSIRGPLLFLVYIKNLPILKDI